ncbi:hypothetical protein L596_024539 [Steinernema carpocapsae]|uniref:Uncharacterized protein n=1 Tax=Steinernema carpocapsae TaxID=34508 RepID=A0A4V5ZZS9_STECR|nr:hypothetical protein L596_024539 [Steinernema carpocapsae]
MRHAQNRDKQTIAAFRRHVEQFDIEACNICDQLFCEKDLLKHPVQSTDETVLKHRDRKGRSVHTRFFVRGQACTSCKACRVAIDSGKLPETAKLNLVEDCLIQLVRPVQHTFYMSDNTGRPTPFKGTKGRLVLLPVPLEPTINDVAEILRLPSTANLTILNSHYVEVEINEQFKLGVNDVSLKFASGIEPRNLVAGGRREHLLSQDYFVVHRKFARAEKYMTFMYGLSVKEVIQKPLAINCRISKHHLTVEKMKNILTSKGEKLQQLTSYNLQELRGTKPYWDNVRLDLRARITVYEPSTFFEILNPC